MFILATAYGLAKWNKIDDEIEMANIDDLLRIQQKEYEDNQKIKKIDYNLLDT